MALASGARLGPCEVVAQIGVGGMGEVYRARDTKLNRDVALKILPEAFTLDGDRIARFRREAQVLASLNHPNIAAIYGFEDSGSTHALVLELVEGPTLADRIANGPIPLDEALPIAKQIAEALEAAHEQGIIHRDLKPANIKLRDDGTVKVLDFGLAKAMEPTSAISPVLTASPTITTPAQMTGVGTLLGTAAYMSPEQAKGRSADKRSDVWAFGCVLYEMLTGKLAFVGEDVSDTLALVLRGEPDWTAIPPGLPPAVTVLVQRCVTKDLRQRVGDIAVARFVLAEAATLSSRAADPAAPDDRARQVLRWSKVGIVTCLSVGAFVGGIIAIALRPTLPSAPVERLSVRLFGDEQQLTGTARRFVAISPDGRYMAHVASQRLWLRALSEYTAHPLVVANSAGINSPTFSPDGREVAFYTIGGMKRVGVAGGAPVPVCPTLAPYGAAWDTTGILVGQAGQGIIRCSISGGAPEQLAVVAPDELADSPQMLPDGRHLLFTIAKIRNFGESAATGRWDQAQIVVQDLKSGQRKTVIPGASDARYLPTGHLLYAVGGVMMAVPFDLRALAVTGTAVPVLEGVSRSRSDVTGAAHVAVSNTGTVLYMPGPVNAVGNIREVALSDRAGTITPLKLAAGPYVHVRVSPNGKQLALGTNEGTEASVWIYDLSETSAIRRLTLDGEGRNQLPIWAPDGERVAFQSNREGDLAIFAKRVDGTGAVERLTKAEKGEVHTPGSWSPDGKTILFTITKPSGSTLWMLSVPHRKATPVANVVSTLGQAIGPVFSADGRWFAYAAAPLNVEGGSASQGVFIQPFPPTGDRWQAPKQQLDFQPLWSRDGRELFYVPSAASGRLAAVRVITRPTVAFDRPEILPARVTGDNLSGEPRAFDILPDGRFVGIVVGAGTDAPGQFELRVVLNWFTELQQRVPVK